MNASDPRQVREADKKLDAKRRLELNDIAWVLSDPRGRRFLWRMLGKTGVYRSIYDNSGSRIAYNSGQQDLGHFLQAEIVETRENALLEMMQEAHAKGEANV